MVDIALLLLARVLPFFAKTGRTSERRGFGKET